MPRGMSSAFRFTGASLLALATVGTLGCGGRATEAGGGASDGGQSASSPLDAANVPTLPGEPLPSDTGGGFSTTLTQSGYGASSLGVMLSNVPNFCVALESLSNPPNATFLALFVNESGEPDPAPAGTYAISTDPQSAVQVTATYGEQNGTCVITLNEAATSGTVTFTTTGPETIAGSYDVRFPGGDHFTGSFSVPICDGVSVSPPTSGDAGPSPPCRP
jgi:hypothetical protein